MATAIRSRRLCRAFASSPRWQRGPRCELDAALENRGPGGAAIQRKRTQINKVAGDVKRDHYARAKSQRQGQISAGIFHLARGERHVVPGIGRKQRSDLRDRKHSQRRDNNTRPPISCMVPSPALRQKFPLKLAAMACALRPRKIPSRTSPNSAEALAIVKTF